LKPPFLISQAQYVDFGRSWAAGFNELVDLLTYMIRLPRTSPSSMEVWHRAQSIGAAKLIDRSEYLWSSFLDCNQSHLATPPTPDSRRPSG